MTVLYGNCLSGQTYYTLDVFLRRRIRCIESGQWLEDWCARCKEDGAVMQEEPGVMANEAPDDDAIAACNALGAKLAVC